MFLSSKFGRVLILALAVGLGVPLTANATFTLRLSSGDLPDKVFTDTDGDGIITVREFDFNGFSFQGDFATSNAASGRAPAILTLSQASIRNWLDEGIRSLIITIEDDEFIAPLGRVDVTTKLAALNLDMSGTGLGQGDVTMQSFLNDTPMGKVSLTESGIGSDSVLTNIGGSKYTLRSVTTINLGQSGILLSSGSTKVSPVPAPATAVMALAGVPVLGAFGWLRRRGRSATTPDA